MNQHLSYAGASDWINRLSWKREDAELMNSLLTRSSTRFIVLNEQLNPLVQDKSNTQDKSDGSNFDNDVPLTFRYLTYQEIKHIVPKDHFKTEEYYKSGGAKNPTLDTTSTQPLVLFLGIEESPNSAHLLPEAKTNLALGSPDNNNKKDDDDDKDKEPSVDAAAYFSIDLTPYPEFAQSLLHSSTTTADNTSSLSSSPSSASSDKKVQFLALRASPSLIAPKHLATAGLARALSDWHRRNKFCAGCGRATVIVHAGWKRFCCPQEDSSNPCMTVKGIHNFSFPRTDAVCITAVVHPDKDKVLLGRQKSWPKGFYSTLAGFIEPGESLGEAVKREIWEEAGIEVENVHFHSSQPWPYPGSLMLGFIAEAVNTSIRTDLDNELEDARWFSRSKVLATLDGTNVDKSKNNGNNLSEEEVKQMQEQYGSKVSNMTQEEIAALKAADSENIALRLPPPTAIANTILTAWAKQTFKLE